MLASSVDVSDAPKRFVYILRSVNHPRTTVRRIDVQRRDAACGAQRRPECINGCVHTVGVDRVGGVQNGRRGGPLRALSEIGLWSGVRKAPFRLTARPEADARATAVAASIEGRVMLGPRRRVPVGRVDASAFGVEVLAYLRCGGCVSSR